MSQSQKLKSFSSCIPSLFSKLIHPLLLFYVAPPYSNLKPDTEQLFYSSSLLLPSFNTVRSSELFLKSLFSTPQLLLHWTKASLLQYLYIVSGIAKAKYRLLAKRQIVIHINSSKIFHSYSIAKDVERIEKQRVVMLARSSSLTVQSKYIMSDNIYV